MKTIWAITKIPLFYLQMRELCWDDGNQVCEPGVGVMHEAGAFEAVAQLLAPSVPRPSGTGYLEHGEEGEGAACAAKVRGASVCTYPLLVHSCTHVLACPDACFIKACGAC